MLKLYKRVDGKLLYREAWVEGADIIEHFGAVDTGLDRFGIDQRGAIRQFLS